MDQEPDWLQMTGWQETDDDHPPEVGEPVYRTVFKTLRVIVPPTRLIWPNLRVSFGHGEITGGEARVRGAVRARRPGTWVVPERGALVPADEPGQLRYEPQPPAPIAFEGSQTDVADSFFVEFVIRTQESDPTARLAEGRRRLSSLQAMMDLRFGPRLLGLRLTEELGQLFDDGHVSRELVSPLLGHECQLDVAALDPEDLSAWTGSELQAHMDQSAAIKQRRELACTWYWTAIHTEDPVNQYLGLFFVLEALWMPDTTNVRPIRERLATALRGCRRRLG